MFDQSYGADGGWGAEASFSTENTGQDSKETKLADKLPIPATISVLAGLEDEKVPYGKMRFASACTIGTVISTGNGSGSIQIILRDPEDEDKTVTITSYDNVGDDGMTDAPVSQLPAEGTLIFAAGKLRLFDGVVGLIAFTTRELDDPREYDIFKKEAEIAQLYWEKGVAGMLRADEGSALTGCAAGAPLQKEAAGDAGGATPAPSAARTPAKPKPTMAPGMQGGGTLRDRILKALIGKRESAGGNDRQDMSVVDVAAAVGIQQAQAKSILEELSQEGHIYNSVDDDHYEAI